MTEPQKPVRVVLLFGGQSAEHEVSKLSAAGVLGALAASAEGYDIAPVAIRPDGRWVRSDLSLTVADDAPAIAPQDAVAPAHEGQQVVVVPILHGPRGEDGTVQGLLELADVAYVGCGVLGASLNMDKATAKVVARAAGLPVCRWISVRDTQLDDALVARVEAELGWPVFVKPSNMGSSVGVSRADDAASLRAAFAEAIQFDEWVVIEEAVGCPRELECGVIGNAEPRVSVVGEIVPTHEFFDYEDKYLDGNVRLDVPAQVPDDIAEQVRDLALQAYVALRCDGLARVDFFWEEATGRLVFNEINTIPGFTQFSMFPQAWAGTGLPFPELVDELIRLALERHAHRAPHRRLR